MREGTTTTFDSRAPTVLSRDTSASASSARAVARVDRTPSCLTYDRGPASQVLRCTRTSPPPQTHIHTSALTLSNSVVMSSRARTTSVRMATSTERSPRARPTTAESARASAASLRLAKQRCTRARRAGRGEAHLLCAACAAAALLCVSGTCAARHRTRAHGAAVPPHRRSRLGLARNLRRAARRSALATEQRLIHTIAAAARGAPRQRARRPIGPIGRSCPARQRERGGGGGGPPGGALQSWLSGRCFFPGRRRCRGPSRRRRS